MPFMKNGKRSYKKELDWEHKTHPNRVKDRAERNAARAEVGLKVGDSRQVDHKKPIISGGTNTRSNLRAVAARTNLEKEAKRKQAVAKKKK